MKTAILVFFGIILSLAYIFIAYAAFDAAVRLIKALKDGTAIVIDWVDVFLCTIFFLFMNFLAIISVCYLYVPYTG